MPDKHIVFSGPHNPDEWSFKRLSAPTLMCCDECRPHVERFVRQFLGQMARLLEEEGDPQAARRLQMVATTWTLDRPESA